MSNLTKFIEVVVHRDMCNQGKMITANIIKLTSDLSGAVCFLQNLNDSSHVNLFSSENALAVLADSNSYRILNDIQY